MVNLRFHLKVLYHFPLPLCFFTWCVLCLVWIENDSTNFFSHLKYMVDWKVKAESTNDMSGRVLWDTEQSSGVNFRLSECRPTLFDTRKGPMFSTWQLKREIHIPKLSYCNSLVTKVVFPSCLLCKHFVILSRCCTDIWLMCSLRTLNVMINWCGF